MATANLASLGDFFRRLTRGMAAETLADNSDQQLVERALAGVDEAPFQAIVHRHGPMVYRVCWRVLQHSQDAEDAFQATFLILARKLRTVRKHASLASWLHGVARRVAHKAKAQSASRRRHERRASPSETLPTDEVTWADFRSTFDSELSQLPDKWRLPLILCYLEGRTQEESASQLGCSKSTLRRRLEEARTALGNRLTRRGITWSAAISAVLLSDCIASSAPAPGLIASTVEAAASVAAGKTVATASSATAAALTEGVLKAMFMTKLKTVTAVLVVALGFLAGGSALFHYETVSAQTKTTGQSTQLKKAQADEMDPRLVGRWEVTSAQSSDAMAKRPVAMAKTIFFPKVGKGDVPDDASLTTKSGEVMALGWSFSTASSPSEMDLAIPDYVRGFNKEDRAFRGIYLVDGDTLKICMVMPPNGRPGDFEFKPGNDRIVLALKRIKEPNANDADDTRAGVNESPTGLPPKVGRTPKTDEKQKGAKSATDRITCRLELQPKVAPMGDDSLSHLLPGQDMLPVIWVRNDSKERVTVPFDLDVRFRIVGPGGEATPGAALALKALPKGERMIAPGEEERFGYDCVFQLGFLHDRAAKYALTKAGKYSIEVAVTSLKDKATPAHLWTGTIRSAPVAIAIRDVDMGPEVGGLRLGLASHLPGKGGFPVAVLLKNTGRTPISATWDPGQMAHMDVTGPTGEKVGDNSPTIGGRSGDLSLQPGEILCHTHQIDWASLKSDKEGAYDFAMNLNISTGKKFETLPLRANPLRLTRTREKSPL